MPERFKGKSCWDPVAYYFSFNPHLISSANQQFITFQIEIQSNEESLSGFQIKKQQTTIIQDPWRHLSKMLHQGIYSAVQFIVKGEKIPAHIYLLQVGSPVLAAMFASDMTEASTRTALINDIEPNVFRQLLHYLYTGTLSFTTEIVEIIYPLFIAADKYQINSLRYHCASFMSRMLNVHNAMRFLVLAHLHSAKKLKEDCICFIVNNKSFFWRLSEFKQLGENYFKLFYDITNRMNMPN